MKFQKYSSIENSYRQLEMHRLMSEGKDKGKWCVQEKVHGSNFSFWVNKKEIRCAKRSGLLSPDDSFYNFQKVYDKNEERLRLFFDSHKSVREITLYGELFGGNYPHPDIEPMNTPSIQKGIFYTPDVEFYLFDMMIDGEFIDVDMLLEYTYGFDFLYAKTIFSGTLYECLEYPNAFQTKIPEWLGLPEIENNFCEGVVIKPNKSVTMKSGSRVLLKNKNPKFSEIGGTKVKKAPVAISPNGENAWQILSTYVTENRLYNVLSKRGEVTFKDFGKILGEMNQDILEDFEKNEGGLTHFELDKPDEKMVKRMMTNESSNLIREHLKKNT